MPKSHEFQAEHLAQRLQRGSQVRQCQHPERDVVKMLPMELTNPSFCENRSWYDPKICGFWVVSDHFSLVDGPFGTSLN